MTASFEMLMSGVIKISISSSFQCLLMFTSNFRYFLLLFLWCFHFFFFALWLTSFGHRYFSFCSDLQQLPERHHWQDHHWCWHTVKCWGSSHCCFCWRWSWGRVGIRVAADTGRVFFGTAESSQIQVLEMKRISISRSA